MSNSTPIRSRWHQTDVQITLNRDYTELCGEKGSLGGDETTSTVEFFAMDENATELILNADFSDQGPTPGTMTFPLS